MLQSTIPGYFSLLYFTLTANVCLLLFVLLAQLGDELIRIKQEIEERGNSMSDGGNITEMLLY